MNETRRLAAEYHKLTGQVLPVSSELGRFYVGNLLSFEIPQQIESGVDLIGTGIWAELKIQIKARVLFNTPSHSKARVGQFKLGGAWQAVALILMNDLYLPQEIYLCQRAALEQAISVPTAQPGFTHKGRGMMSVAKFKAISLLIWAEGRGIITDEK